MSTEKTGLLARLFRLEVLLVAFVLQPALKIIPYVGTNPDMVRTQLLAVCVYVILAWFTWRRQVVATWGTSIIMMVNGVLTIATAFAGMLMPELMNALADAVLVVLNLLVGAYFLYGGYVVFSQRPRWRKR